MRVWRRGVEEAELFGVSSALYYRFGLLVGEHGPLGVAAFGEDGTLHYECPGQPVLRPFAAVVVRSLGYGCIFGHRQVAFVFGSVDISESAAASADLICPLRSEHDMADSRKNAVNKREMI